LKLPLGRDEVNRLLVFVKPGEGVEYVKKGDINRLAPMMSPK